MGQKDEVLEKLSNGVSRLGCDLDRMVLNSIHHQQYQATGGRFIAADTPLFSQANGGNTSSTPLNPNGSHASVSQGTNQMGNASLQGQGPHAPDPYNDDTNTDSDDEFDHLVRSYYLSPSIATGLLVLRLVY